MWKALFGSVTFHVAVGVGLLSTAWWWTTDDDVHRPPELAVSLAEPVPEISDDSPPTPVEPPVETAVEIIPVIEVDAPPFDVLETLPPAEEYKAVRPWMPRGLRYRPSKLPPHLRDPNKTANPVIALARPPQPAQPQASVLLAPAIDAEQCPAPEYPRRARRMRWEGTTQLIVTVDAAGNPTAIRVSVSSGHQILDDAAIKAVQAWHFHPANRDGTPEAGDLLVPIRFDITG